MMNAQPKTKLHIQHDGLLTISTGTSRKTVKWRHRELLWSELLQRLSVPVITAETLAEYKASPKSRRDEIKDTGGFVGGPLQGGRRKADAIRWRQVVTLDADTVTSDLWAAVELLFEHACAIYSTHSHSPERPRLRLIIPLSRAVTVEEYQAVSRRIAADLGIDQFDPTTFEAHRLMYWPSSPKDVEPVFHYQDLPWINPDDVLARYSDWRDPASWPEPAGAHSARQKQAAAQEDPHAKSGIVGAFCRTYSIEEAIETFLSDVYEPVGEGRYTYKPGSTTGGLVLYDDGKFAYSHHGTDPVSGLLVNAFDLVRLHKYGELDDAAEPGTPVVRLPSYVAMTRLAADDEAVRLTIGQETQAAIAEDFGDEVATTSEEDNDWVKKLELNRKGEVIATRHNILLVLEHDPRLAGKIALNEFTGRPAVRGRLPWKSELHWQDHDDEALRHYLERVYRINSPDKTKDALGVLLTRHRFHPVREYLTGLVWDGQERIDTLLIDYLGADDTPYVRAVTRKALTAAVARVMEPGCKWDYVLTLVGRQGIGKSLLLKKLGKGWYSDTLDVMTGKGAYEQLQGVWIMELGELAAMRRAEAEAVKHFITKQEDIYRVAYGRHTGVFPRQCVFFGTTNTAEFLRDVTGNRRFWPVQCRGDQPKETLLDLTEADIDQIWAEAYMAYTAGGKLYLTGELAQTAMAMQEAHREESEKAGVIRAYLDIPLPADWENWSIAQRREYLHGGDFGQAETTGEPRQRVCVMEVWVELFMGDPKQLTRAIATEIHDVLKTAPGWQRHDGNQDGKLRFKPYGMQRAYTRTGSSFDAEA